MEANLSKLINLKITKTIENLKKNNINAVYVPTGIEALALMKSIIKEGESIGVGGSVTLDQIGALDLFRNGDYMFFDRYDKSKSKDELIEIDHKALCADYFVCSSNAITENGYLYNVDGRGTRAASFVYGPKKVLVVAGYNKIVPKLEDAIKRVKSIACPANCVRLDRDTYCVKNGNCICDRIDFEAGECEHSICCSTVISGHQVDPNRITVILVGEILGY